MSVMAGALGVELKKVGYYCLGAGMPSQQRKISCSYTPAGLGSGNGGWLAGHRADDPLIPLGGVMRPEPVLNSSICLTLFTGPWILPSWTALS